MQEHDAVVGLVHVLCLVRGHDDGDLGRDAAKDPPEALALRWIEAGGGLVEQDDLGVVDERSGDAHPPRLSARELGGSQVGFGPEVDDVQGADGTSPRVAPAEALQPPGVRDVLADGEPGEGGDLLGEPRHARAVRAS
ncbi:hypothetical protein MAFF212519_11370 [Clavibacter michiganensis]